MPEEGVEKTAKETAEEVMTKGVKQVGEKIDKELIPKYLDEVEAFIFVMVSYVVLSLFVYILFSFATFNYEVDDTACTLGISLIVAIYFSPLTWNIYITITSSGRTWCTRSIIYIYNT